MVLSLLGGTHCKDLTPTVQQNMTPRDMSYKDWAVMLLPYPNSLWLPEYEMIQHENAELLIILASRYIVKD
jgi:hypothetical protein